VKRDVIYSFFQNRSQMANIMDEVLPPKEVLEIAKQTGAHLHTHTHTHIYIYIT
jgi:hypothetical protein